MNKYTSGQWTIKKQLDTVAANSIITIQSNGYVLAICGKDTWALPKEQQEANASLIRNAPALYETLKYAAILLNRYVFSVHPCDTIHQAEKQLIERVLKDTNIE